MQHGLIWLPEDRSVQEGTARQAQKANAAAREVFGDADRLDAGTLLQLRTRLDTLRRSLQQRLLPGITDFKRYDLQARLADVDRLFAQVTAQLAQDAQEKYDQAGDLGIQAIDEPMKAAGVKINPALPGLDKTLVQAAFGNTVDLLTLPMQQFAGQVKVNLRAVSLAGDGRMDAIMRLEQSIAGQGFDNARYKAERIIRTELSRTFNGATFERLLALSKEFPFLRKGWRATHDSRTRQGHKEAGQTYPRGKGILVAALFQLNVYDERPGKAPKFLGVAQLRFPVDPQVQPPGRIGAAATIMCRCNAFVDFDMADYAAFVAKQVKTIVPGVPAGAPVTDTGAGTFPDPKAFNYKAGRFNFTKAAADSWAAKFPGATVRQTGPAGTWQVYNAAGQVLGVGGWKAAARPRVAKAKPAKAALPGVKLPTAADVTPTATTVGPAGPKVSAAMDIAAGYDAVKKALDVLDSVHGDGQLPKIPVGPLPARYRSKAAAGYIYQPQSNRAIGLGFGKKILKESPHMGVFHETGHFLDNQGIVKGGHASALPPGFTTTAEGKAVEHLMNTLKNSKAIQRLRLWYDANTPTSPHKYGDGVVPMGVNRTMVTYLLRSSETFARAYAQYVTVKSGNAAALKELRNMQASSKAALGEVAKDWRFNPTAVSAKAPTAADTWDYPWQWQDEDFKPIEAAFDSLMDVLGWRKRS